jgi:hypothetical protein
MHCWAPVPGSLKKWHLVGHWWLMPVILVTQEAEIRRIPVWSQPRANSSRDPISKKKKKITKEGGGVAQGVGPEFKPQYHTQKKVALNDQHHSTTLWAFYVLAPQETLSSVAILIILWQQGWDVVQWYSACLASTRPWLWFPVPHTHIIAMWVLWSLWLRELRLRVVAASAALYGAEGLRPKNSGEALFFFTPRLVLSCRLTRC